MNIETKMKCICALVSVALLLTVLCVVKSYSKPTSEEKYAQYPFSPISPEGVIPWNTQSVYSMPNPMFNVCSGTDEPQPGCAWKTLAIAEAQQNLADNLNIEWVSNDAYDNPNVGAGYLLSISDYDPRVWSYL